MTKVKDLHEKWMKNPDYQAEYDALAPEFSLAIAVAQARVKADLTQEQLADLMQTSQTAIARLESGKGNPTTATLEKLAKATGTRLKIEFEYAPIV